jgi:hypothetical protein
MKPKKNQPATRSLASENSVELLAGMTAVTKCDHSPVAVNHLKSSTWN